MYRGIADHRSVVAEAAKYDHHPLPVVPGSTNHANGTRRNSAHRPGQHYLQSNDLQHNHDCQWQNHGKHQTNGSQSQAFTERKSPSPCSFGSSSSDHGRSEKTSDHSVINPVSKSKMERGISKASENEFIINQARFVVESQFQPASSPDSPDLPHLVNDVRRKMAVWHKSEPGSIDTPVCTFILPDLTIYNDDFRGFLEKDLIELSSLVSLEQCGRLNWWIDFAQRLWPLATTGDGNCLLHAASLAMWGFHDRLLTLRKALHAFLSSGSAADSIYRRWRLQCHQQNLQFGLHFTEPEWSEEWKGVLRLASSEPRHGSSSSGSSASSDSPSYNSTDSPVSSSSSTRFPSNADSIDNALRSSTKEDFVTSGNTKSRRRSMRLSMAVESHENPPTGLLYESLEEIHVLALAHVLRRPIVVVADTVLKDMNGEPLAPIPFGGVYLPLEYHPSQCHRSPLLLTYNAGHFSALVAMANQKIRDESRKPAVIPLMDANLQLLPIHFGVDPGADFIWSRDGNDARATAALELTPSEQMQLLSDYMDLIKFSFPHEYCSSPTIRRQTNHKGFGSLGKNLRKTLGRFKKNGSFRGKEDMKGNSNNNSSFIIAALIHCHVPLPYQTEMVENYLEEARKRFEVERDQRAREHAEQKEIEEKRIREIYLNGGYLDCMSSGCNGRISPETINSIDLSDKDLNILCKKCRRLDVRDTIIKHGNSRFYLNRLSDESSCDESHHSSPVLSTSSELRVKLPPQDELRLSCVDSSSRSLCKSPGCEFYGSSKFEEYCSKCYSRANSAMSNVSS